MPEYQSLVFSDEFLESLLRGHFGAADQRRLLRALRLLDENEQHPSLRVHDLKGDLAGLWSASASDVLRITFRRLPQGRKALVQASRHYDE